jgi:hypothetical protein
MQRVLHKHLRDLYGLVTLPYGSTVRHPRNEILHSCCPYRTVNASKHTNTRTVKNNTLSTRTGAVLGLDRQLDDDLAFQQGRNCHTLQKPGSCNNYERNKQSKYGTAIGLFRHRNTAKNFLCGGIMRVSITHGHSLVYTNDPPVDARA